MAEQEAAGGGQIPYIGSLISLVSASGQRYRGTLYTVDLNESTIALQNGAQLQQDRTPSDTCHTLHLRCQLTACCILCTAK
jgi:Scd6-like Sm domain